MSRKTKRNRTAQKYKKAKMGGGFFDFLGTTTTSNSYGTSTSDSGSWFDMDSFTKGASDFWNKTKKAAEDSYKSMSQTQTPTSSVYPEERKYIPPPPSHSPAPVQSFTPSYVPPPAYAEKPELPSQPQYMTPFGGKRTKKSRRHRMRMRGGYTANTPTTGIAFSAAPFSGYTAQPQVWVGGKTKKRRMHKKNRSNKRRR